jgi:hypothetical protein
MGMGHVSSVEFSLLHNVRLVFFFCVVIYSIVTCPTVDNNDS